MQTTHPAAAHVGATPPVMGAERSVVSWGAVLAGAVIAAAMSAMLLAGASGLGFMSISPWQNEGASATAITIGAVVWLLITQIIVYGIAGYVTGRLRTRWTDTAADEVYFRDTAHGFLVWAVSVIVTLALLGSAVSSIVSGTAKTGAALAGGAAATVASTDAPEGMSLDYFTDTLLRAEQPAGVERQGDTRREVGTILVRSAINGEVAPEDETYLVRVVADYADVDEAAARQRLDQVWAQVEEFEQGAREAADDARKAAAAFSLWAFISLLLGAFIASFAATIGGRARDR